MNFSSVEYYIFLLICVSLAFLLRKHDRPAKCLLLLGSYYFYSLWDWRFLGLIFASTIIDYVIGNAIHSCSDQFQKKRFLILSVFSNLSILGFFKYFNFFRDNLLAITGQNSNHFTHWDIILPVGISFYTFQTMSYTIDLYRGSIKRPAPFLDFSLYVAFFPQLVAGPIVRAIDLLPQFRKPLEFSQKSLLMGARIIALGLFKKSFIADNVAPYVDFVFENHEALNSTTLLFGAIGYSIQIYGDFSGYSDIAIGSARLFGLNFQDNFRMPYLSKTISEFWRRWHISLSSWLRDYLYISLGGNRVGPLTTYRNLLLTMTLGGLWHGAAWTFVLWGIWHGCWLGVNRFSEVKFPVIARFLQNRLTTLSIVVFGWILFRAQSLPDAVNYIWRMISFENGVFFIRPFIGVAIGFTLLGHVLEHHFSFDQKYRNGRLPGPVLTYLALMMIFLVLLYRNEGFQPFIYFQF